MNTPHVNGIFGLSDYMGAWNTDYSFSDLFCTVGDSLLTTVVLCFIARWILRILIDIAKRGGKY